MMTVAEMFCSLQGEGTWAGMPSVFIRFAGCNLACVWCDTPYASREPLESRALSIAEILMFVDTVPTLDHVVLTGGEPMLQKELPTLTAALAARKKMITVETNGTLPPMGVHCDLASLSPKLQNSGNAPELSADADMDAVREWIYRYRTQLKFVISTADDVHAVQAYLGALGEVPPKESIFLMPQGRRPDDIEARTKMLIGLCQQTGYRYCRRMQLDLFGDTRGT